MIFVVSSLVIDTISQALPRWRPAFVPTGLRTGEYLYICSISQIFPFIADVAELVDAHASEACIRMDV